jgi:FAD/FMN-containing dehydrogenase
MQRNPGGIAYGMGRSYGDVCLNAGGVLWATVGMDRFMEFDTTSGRIVCEAGVLLRDVQQLAVPRGWMLPVSPGTQFVTVGGAIANDVHGKNHHAFGSFGNHVRRIVLQRTDGETIECGPGLRDDWFRATVGGLGLTGLILAVEIQLRQVQGAWLDAESIPYANLDEFFELAGGSEAAWEYTASWIDCLSGVTGRGIFMRANHAEGGEIEPRAKSAIRVPFTPPFSLINRFSLRLFNESYFQLGRLRSGTSRPHYGTFLYPLDNVDEWNRIYGPRGFFQYQFVVPQESGREALRSVLGEIRKSGIGSFLAVLKTFANRESPGILGFPQPGVTLALDFPNSGSQTARLFDRIDRIVADAGGRVYMAKDARMPRWLFEAGYPAHEAFLPFRDPGISSDMSRRLMGY